MAFLGTVSLKIGNQKISFSHFWCLSGQGSTSLSPPWGGDGEKQMEKI